MARRNKQTLALVSALSREDVKKILATVILPKANRLCRRKEQLEKELRIVTEQLERLGGVVPGAKPAAPAPVKRRARRRARKPAMPVKPAPVAKAPVSKAPAAKGETIAGKISGILSRAAGPMSVKEITEALIRLGSARKPSLGNYVNQVLARESAFQRAGYGLYRLRGAASAAPAQGASRKKASPAGKAAK